MYNNLQIARQGHAENSTACQMEIENGQSKWGTQAWQENADRQDGRKWAWLPVMPIRYNRKSMAWCLSLQRKRSPEGWSHMQKAGSNQIEWPFPPQCECVCGPQYFHSVIFLYFVAPRISALNYALTTIESAWEGKATPPPPPIVKQGNSFQTQLLWSAQNVLKSSKSGAV